MIKINEQWEVTAKDNDWELHELENGKLKIITIHPTLLDVSRYVIKRSVKGLPAFMYMTSDVIEDISDCIEETISENREAV